MDTLTVYEGGQEALGHGVETLHEHGENQTYGTTEGTYRRTVCDEQG